MTAPQRGPDVELEAPAREELRLLVPAELQDDLLGDDVARDGHAGDDLTDLQNVMKRLVFSENLHKIAKKEEFY